MGFPVVLAQVSEESPVLFELFQVLFAAKSVEVVGDITTAWAVLGSLGFGLHFVLGCAEGCHSCGGQG